MSDRLIAVPGGAAEFGDVAGAAAGIGEPKQVPPWGEHSALRELRMT